MDEETAATVVQQGTRACATDGRPDIAGYELVRAVAAPDNAYIALSTHTVPSQELIAR